MTSMKRILEDLFQMYVVDVLSKKNSLGILTEFSPNSPNFREAVSLT